MDDQALFQNTDEQEAAYAPQEMADEATRERVLADEGTLGENRDSGDARPEAVMPIPGPGATGALHNVGQTNGSTTPGVSESDIERQERRD